MGAIAVVKVDCTLSFILNNATGQMALPFTEDRKYQ